MNARPRVCPNDGAVLIVGASVRAAAESARLAGVQTLAAADLFGDSDLLDAVDCYQRLAPGYEGLADFVSQRDDPYSMYTGALENYPRQIERLPGQLLGAAQSVCLVRDPSALRRVLCDAGCDSPQLLMPKAVPKPPGDLLTGEWLIKPVRSAGGLGIKGPIANPNLATLSGEVYLQQYLSGAPWGGVFVGNGQTAQFLGATRSLGHRAAPCRFQFAGCVGPMPLRSDQWLAWHRLGCVLAKSFGLRGLFGVDVVMRDDRLFVVEVNPRWTASVEVLEHASSWNAFAVHVAACHSGELPTDAVVQQPPTQLIGKQIVYASRSLIVSPASVDTWHSFRRTDRTAGTCARWIADLPVAGSKVGQHHPLVSVFCAVTPSNREPMTGWMECCTALRDFAEQVERRALASRQAVSVGVVANSLDRRGRLEGP